MVNIHHQNHVQRFSRQLRIGDGAQHRPHVAYTRSRHFVGENVQHLRLYLLRIDPTGFVCRRVGTDRFCQQPGVIAGARPNIRHDITRFKLEQRDEQVGAFFLLPFRTFQPIGGLMPHYVGNLAAQIKFANTIRVMIRPEFVKRCWRNRIFY